MFREPFPVAPQKTKTSGSSSKNSSELVAIPFMFLDLGPGAGNLLEESYWEILSPYRGESLILNTGPAPRSGAAGSTLWSILEERPHPKYYLSRKACLGILRRSSERGKQLPPALEYALQIQAGFKLPSGVPISRLAYHINQRDEGIDPHGVSGALMATANMQMQTFVTEPQQGPVGVDGYNGDVTGAVSATLGTNCGMTTGRNGVMMPMALHDPEIICLNDQGGQFMNCSQSITGTLRVQMNAHQPLVLATQQGGAEIGNGVCPTITASAGMSGNNQPVLYENHSMDSRYVDHF